MPIMWSESHKIVKIAWIWAEHYWFFRYNLLLISSWKGPEEWWCQCWDKQMNRAISTYTTATNTNKMTSFGQFEIKSASGNVWQGFSTHSSIVYTTYYSMLCKWLLFNVWHESNWNSIMGLCQQLLLLLLSCWQLFVQLKLHYF